MGLKLKAVDPVVLVAGVVVIVVAWKTYKEGKKVAEAIHETVTKTLNPVSTENWVYKSANSTVAAITGNEYDGFSIGGWLYEITHPNEPNYAEPYILNAGTL